MEQFISLFIKAVFVENMALAFFLGMCTFLALSKNVKTALGLGIAVIFVLAVTVPLNNIILNYLLAEGALTWISDDFATVDLSFWLAVVHQCGAASVQILEMFLDKFVPVLCNALGVPAVDYGELCNFGRAVVVERDYGFGESIVYGDDAGWLGADIVALAEIREKLAIELTRDLRSGHHLRHGGAHVAGLHVLLWRITVRS